MTPAAWFALSALVTVGALICALRAHRLSKHQDKLRARRNSVDDRELFL